MTLDAREQPNAVFVFQVDAALNTAASSHIKLVNGAQASNVYWQVLGAAGTGANSTFVGTILANGSITLGNRTLLIGRALSKGGVLPANTTVRFTPWPGRPGTTTTVVTTRHGQRAHEVRQSDWTGYRIRSCCGGP